MLIKILGVGLITTIISLVLREYKSDYYVLVSICGGLVIFFILIDGIVNIIDGIQFIGESAGVSWELIKIVIKIIGAGYLTEFMSDIAEDSGNKFVSSKVIIGGKVAICVMAFPIIKTLFQTIISLI